MKEQQVKVKQGRGSLRPDGPTTNENENVTQNNKTKPPPTPKNVNDDGNVKPHKGMVSGGGGSGTPADVKALTGQPIRQQKVNLD
jgi:hypothetical protein